MCQDMRNLKGYEDFCQALYVKMFTCIFPQEK